ncbi:MULTISPECIES: HIT family protein [Corynebacterium]|uniref:HIT family protein n=1 Tax=Corynebacterium aurimucosum TaxID=169292 RepID=A0A558GJ99_9CORY|nr:MULTISPECIES: HIT family protein [Corynebacterium]MBU5654710.1 HIT family protein [Corynebacterium aurimucosum]MDK6813372.1 HIT family protein [Corynebacterium sp. UMB6689]OFL23705.1 HIT family hydrolase [Corynebacterium sp. HMSC062A03]OFQ35868.1 HIT family hydrolase [Corynebacterium sp. HMSC072D12]OFS39430.1 HIT family hydrolase [Corynebacterium sp. HMSC069E04]
MSSVFTKIIEGELPARFVYRDEKCVAFLSIEPLRYGHTLVVPVEEVDKWTDLDSQTWAHLNEIALEIGGAIKTAFDTPRTGYIIAGFDVPHTHIHLFPTEKMEDYDFAKAFAADATDPAAMDEAAARIRQHLGTDEDGRRSN